MQDNSKPNLRSKLRLKRDNNVSSQSQSDTDPKIIIENKTEKEDTNCDNESTPNDNPTSNAEDSLADFKSPKAETSNRPIFSKFKIDAEKVKRKLTKSKTKSSNSKKKTTTSKDQPSIESALFKPQVSEPQNEVQISFPCPLCLKPFKDEISCTNHMKTCASRSNVSVRQLLDAKRLQDRQAEERKAMGLPAAPIIPEKKKTNRPKNFSTKDDPQLQLALALSESSYQAEQMEELEHAALLEGFPSECIRHMDEEDRRRTLQNFGFTTNKPIENAPTTRTKKRKLLGPTILQSRTKEDKDRVLTERIACILTGDDALTQIGVKNDSVAFSKTLPSLRSHHLKNIEQTRNKLWDQSRLTKKHSDFYVKELKYHFLQLEQSNKDGPAELESDSNVQNYSLNYSIEYEPMEIDLIINNSEEESHHNSSGITHSENMKTEIDFMKNNIHNWSETLNDSAASDILILTRSRHIYGHKLVFHVQCSNILLDVETNDSNIQPRIREKIVWNDKDHVPALAFLEFIYCGAIIKNKNVFDNGDYLSQVNKLARHYRVEKLFSYIRMKKREFESKVVNREPKQDGPKSSLLEDKSQAQKCVETEVQKTKTSDVQPETQVLCGSDSTLIQSTPVTNKSVLSNVMSDELLLNDRDSRRFTASPDLFESENEDDRVHIHETQQNSETQSHDNNVNLKILESLIVQEDMDQFSQRKRSSQGNMEVEQVGISSSQNTIVNLSESPSPENHELSPDGEALHEASTPPTTRSPRKNSENSERNGEICDIITPQTRSPKSPEETYSKITDHEESDFKHEAVTPEACTPPRFDEYVTQRQERPCAEESPPAISVDDFSMYSAVTPPKNAVSEQESNSIHIAVTPPAPPSQVFDLSSEENVRSLRSSLNSFINKVQRKNARGPLDSDSDENSSVNVDSLKNNKKKKNPFSKKYQDDSYRYLRNEGPKKSADKRVISLLENDELQVNDDSEKSVEDKIISSRCSQECLKRHEKEDLLGDFQNQNPKSVTIEMSSEELLVSPSTQATRIDDSELISKSKSQHKEGDQSTAHETFDLLDDSQMSMYSKYKSTNKNDNSIAKYRDKINFGSVVDPSAQPKNIEEPRKSNSSKASSTKDTNVAPVTTSKSQKFAKADDICVILDSDEEEIGAEVSAKRKESSTVDMPQKQNPPKDGEFKTSNSSSGSTGSSRRRSQSRNLTSSIGKKSSGSLDSTDDQVWLGKKSGSDNIVFRSKKSTKIIDISMSDEEERQSTEADSSGTKRKSDQAHGVSKKRKTSISSKSNHDLDEIDDEINKILELSPNFQSSERLSENKFIDTEDKKDDSIIQCDGINSSPISIISSPGPFQQDENVLQEAEPSEKLGNSDEHIAGTDAIEDECFDLDFNDEWIPSPHLQGEKLSQNQRSDSSSRRRLSFEESIPKTLPVSESLSTESETQSPKTHKSPISSFVSSPILSQNRRNARSPQPKLSGSQPQSSRTQESPISSLISSPILSQSRRNARPSQSKVSGSEILNGRNPENVKSRKLKAKSVSASNLPVGKAQAGGCSLQRSSSFVTPEQNKKTRKNQDVTPPVDYSLLDTPELQKQLSRFGVKPQSRNNAKQLLRHIYEVTHPIINNNSNERASSSESSSEDEQPPVKKLNAKRNSASNQRKGKKDCDAPDPDENRPVIAEEMEYDEVDNANVPENPVSIKDAFCKLIESDSELYTKVLTYEPLPLESLHAMLKQNGLKCKMNSLMDFLDEQCITFQVQNGKGSRTKRRAK